MQRVSGEPFAAYVQHHIFTPLGMTHSTFEQPLPKGFVATKGYLQTSKDDTGFEGVTEVPAGGLSSTAADMAIFGQMLLGHGTYNGVQILQPASVALLLTPQFTPGPGVTPWDLGFYDADRNGLRFIGHGGDLIACHSQFWIEPTHGLSFFISYNSQGAAQKARGELFNAFVDRYLPGPPNAHPAYVKLTAKQLAPYTGYFLSSRREDSTIFRLVGLQPKEITATKDGNLTISTAKDFYGHPIDFHPVGNDSFYDELDQNTIHFERDAHGHVIGYATPSHSDRAPLLAAGQWLNVPLAIAVVTMLLLVIAALVRTMATHLSAQAREARTAARHRMGDLLHATRRLRCAGAADIHRRARLPRLRGHELLPDRTSRPVAARRGRSRRDCLPYADLRVPQQPSHASPPTSLDHAVEVHHRDAVLPLPRVVPAVLPPHLEPESVLAMRPLRTSAIVVSRRRNHARCGRKCGYPPVCHPSVRSGRSARTRLRAGLASARSMDHAVLRHHPHRFLRLQPGAAHAAQSTQVLSRPSSLRLSAS